jgi:ubiquitin thioesterase protein OTUB1
MPLILTFASSHFNVAHFNNPEFTPEQWKPEFEYRNGNEKRKRPSQ